MKKPKTAVLDGDILVYKAAFWADMEGIDELPDRLKYDVKKWTPKGCKPVLAFSCPRSQNFRRRFWPDYKAHRDDTMQPDSKDYAVEIIVDGFDVVEYPQLEADDIMGIEASAGDAIAVTDPIQFGRAMAWCVRILRHGEYDKSSQLIQLWKHGYKGDQHAIQMF
jgi:hypothetical protein